MFLKKYKQLIAGVIIGSVVASTGVAAANQKITAYLSDIDFTFDGVRKDVPSGFSVLNYDGRTYVPARFVAEELGATVDWNNDTRTVVIKTKDAPNPNLQSFVVNKTATSGPMKMKISKVTFDPAYKSDQYSKAIKAVVLAVEVENTSTATINWHPNQGTIAMNTKEQARVSLWNSDNVGGEFIGQVIKKGNIVVEVSSDFAAINSLTFKVDGAFDGNYDRVGDDTLTEIPLR